MTLLSDYPADNVVRFPVEMSRPDLDTLIAIEPDVLFVDELSERHGLDMLPFDSIESGEIEGNALIDRLSRHHPADAQAELARFHRAAMAEAIRLCLRAREADSRAARLRREADIASVCQRPGHVALAQRAMAAEHDAAVRTLAAIAAAHRARGIDAAVTMAPHRGRATSCFGILDML
ncbi:MAG: hypothetical protein PHI71_06335 [Acidiphilium sp.]|jgi:hypothetical protein|nr:hypothetical protein [Acidiphilium sp.]